MAACIRISVLSKAGWYSIVREYIPHSVYPRIFSERWGCFYLVAVVSSAVVNMNVQVALRTLLSSPLRSVPRAGLLGHRVGLF